MSEQHLLVGVPTLSRRRGKAHLFRPRRRSRGTLPSGNSLAPGDYRVGEAFPHPRQENAFFHLVSLPTPRRRMAYMSCGNADEQKRLAALSRRTLDQCWPTNAP